MVHTGTNGTSGLVGAYFNLVKSLLGIGLLTFPFGFSLVGNPLGIATTVIVVLLVRISMILLLYVDDILDVHAVGSGKRTYPSIVQLALSVTTGDKWCNTRDIMYWMTLLTIVVGQFGSCVGYLTFVGSNLHQLLPSVPLHHAVIGAAAFVLPAALIPRIRALYPVSVLGMLALLSAIAAFGAYCGASKDGPVLVGQWTMVKWDGLFRFTGIALFASEGITAIPSVKYSLRHLGERTTGKLVQLLDYALLTMTVMLLAAGTLGWNCLGQHPPSIITKGLPDEAPSTQFIRAALSLYILCTYPLQLFPAAEAIEELTVAPAATRGGGELADRESDEDDTAVIVEPEILEQNNVQPHAGESDEQPLISTSRRFALTARANAGLIEDPPSPGRHHPVRLTANSSATSWSRLRRFVCGKRTSNSGWAHLYAAFLRVLFVTLTTIVATQLTQFGMFISLMGWLAFGVLSFVIPPYMYISLIQRLFAHRRHDLDRGQHWAAWSDRLHGLPVAKIEVLNKVMAELELQSNNPEQKFGSPRPSPPNSGRQSPIPSGSRPASTPVPSARTVEQSVFSPSSARHQLAGTQGCCKKTAPVSRSHVSWWASTWFWEQLGLYVYLIGGTVVTIAGMAMVVFEATNDTTSSDHVSS